MKMESSNQGKRKMKDFDLNKEPSPEPVCPKANCTAASSSEAQVPVNAGKEAEGKIVIKQADNALVEKSAADGADQEQPVVLPTEERRKCTRYRRGSSTRRRCREDAHPGYRMCLKHITESSECLRRWRELKKKLLKASAAETVVVSSKTVAADGAAPPAVAGGGGRKDQVASAAVASSAIARPLLNGAKKKRMAVPTSGENATGGSSSGGESCKSSSPAPAQGP